MLLVGTNGVARKGGTHDVVELDLAVVDEREEVGEL